MLDEADGPMNFTQMVTLFASKMAGGTDDDETIIKEKYHMFEYKYFLPSHSVILVVKIFNFNKIKNNNANSSY